MPNIARDLSESICPATPSRWLHRPQEESHFDCVPGKSVSKTKLADSDTTKTVPTVESG